MLPDRIDRGFRIAAGAWAASFIVLVLMVAVLAVAEIATDANLLDAALLLWRPIVMALVCVLLGLWVITLREGRQALRNRETWGLVVLLALMGFAIAATMPIWPVVR